MEYIQLNNGIKMPSIGFGVYQIPLLMTKQCVLDALAIGYRHIDTAGTMVMKEKLERRL